jgi:thiamine pyrophosphokinase
MYAAANIALEQGYDVLHIYGGTGGRFDHTFANVQLLKHISGQGARGYMFTAEKTEQPMQVITVITNSCITFPKEYRGYVSVFALDEKCEGVTIRGLKYTLDNAELYNNYPLGVSNEFTGTESCIDVKSGSAAIIFDYNDYNI